MKKLYSCALAVALVALSAPSAFAGPGELKLSMARGLVTIVADQVPVSRILAEWARVGQTRIVNGDKLLTTVSIQLVDWPERKALDLLLRSASGYMAAERQGAPDGASTLDRVMILPFSRGPANTIPAAASPPPFNARPMPQPQPDVDDDPVVQPPGAPQPGTLPSFPGIPQPASGQPQQTTAPTTLPRPGMLPQPAGPQPVPFGTPAGTPPKPPGGGGGSSI
ncbi:MAG: hypothetical protein ABIP65_05160 [Vicinamibacterales bacterium]